MADFEPLFAVVQFKELVNRKKSVELLPISWLCNNNTRCYFPSKKDYDKIDKWVQDQCDPGEDWPSFQITVISKAKDYEQGLRRLKRSFKKKDINTSDSESLQSCEPLELDSEGVSKALLYSKPLITARKNVLETIVENSNIGESSSSQIILNNEVIDDLKSFIKKEINNAKRSILYDMEQKINTLKREILQRTIDVPAAYPEPWKIIGQLLPATEIDKFLEFDSMLSEDIEKKEALINIFRSETIGSNCYETDIVHIFKKLIGKEVQLEYSACGRLVNGVGKKNFSATQFYKAMNEFIMSKYSDSKEQLKMIHVTSKFLAGAKDRDGGRSKRYKKD